MPSNCPAALARIQAKPRADTIADLTALSQTPSASRPESGCEAEPSGNWIETVPSPL
ncbi:hypothetical protein GCM10009789_07250 [Kribbella sancticallisti]|uniref:Uncharacterized protein n=1 Tax=Kribbella sancticallisti TaxID=460087 RepID=A0ABN2CC64_9ACTN